MSSTIRFERNHLKKPRFFWCYYLVLLLLSINISFADESSSAQTTDKSLSDLLNTSLPTEANVGSREGAQVTSQSLVPTEVYTLEQIENSGIYSLTNLLRYLVAGFNSPEPSITDATDHVRPFTLRGMDPDQILILVNGKRLHSSPILHINGTIGRGSSHVDLEAIAVESIERIELLRDGAAAQYGSDAIAGVINIVLKSLGHKNQLSAQVGKRQQGDGLKKHVAAFMSHELKYDGFLNLTLSADKAQQTNHAGLDSRLEPPTQSTHFGLPDQTNYRAVLNSEAPLYDGLTPYINATFNQRDSRAGAFFRTPDASRTLFPEGFLPQIQAKITNYSFNAGIKKQVSKFSWDLSFSQGSNLVQFLVNNSINFSMGANSPTHFNNGELKFTQQMINLDLSGKYLQTNWAGGIEYRKESYSISSGQLESYISATDVLDVSGGSQGFPGFSVNNETHRSRHNLSLYSDLRHQFSSAFEAEGAIRYENYSDFGNKTSVKTALSYQLTPKLMLRGGVNSGFRAPSLSQSSFSYAASAYDTVSQQIISQGTYRPDHPIAIALGATSLKPESSINFSFGSVLKLSSKSTLAVDIFSTKVFDRIGITPVLTAQNEQQQQVMDAYQVSWGQYFTNNMDTKTQGLNLRYDNSLTLSNQAELTLSIGYNYNKNEVIDFNPMISDRSMLPITRLEHGQPNNSIKLRINYQKGPFNISLNNNIFSSHQEQHDVIINKFKGGIISDVNITYQLTKKAKLSIGANNIFDFTPQTWTTLSGVGVGYDGIIPYSEYEPYGHSGRFYYLSATIEF